MAPESASNKIGKTVGERLRAARIAQNITQGQLAAPDFSVSYISAIERGQIHPSLRALEILSNRLGLSSTQLLPNRAQQDELDHARPEQPEREEDENALALLEIQILLHQEEATQARALLDKLPLKKLKRPQQLQHHYLSGWAHLLMDNLQQSEQALLEAKQIANDINDQYFITHTLNFLGLVYGKTHNYQQALLSHQRCLNILESADPQDSLFIIEVYSHMGQHYMDQGDIDQAFQKFTAALEQAAKLVTSKEIQRFYLGQCASLTLTKAYDIATICAYKSSYLYGERTRRDLQATLYYHLGEALLQENPQGAESYLDEALHTDGVQQDALAQASLFLHKGQIYFTRHDLVHALDCTQQAYTLARTYTNSPITAEILLTLGRIEYASEHYDEGDQHFVAGLELLEHLGTQEELADQSVQYAQLLEQRGKAREAFNYFRRAFQSSQRSR